MKPQDIASQNDPQGCKGQLEKLLNILQHKSKSTKEFLDHVLNEAIEITESKFGYIFRYNEAKKEFVLNAWSRNVMKECAVAIPEICYELDKSGIWGEAVRQRKPIIINEFEEENPLKKGYPEGHVKLHSFLTIPIFKEEKIVGVVGLANKETAYTQEDLLQLQIMMDIVWKVVELRDTIDREQHLKNVLLGVRNVNQIITKEKDTQTLINKACDNLTETMGYYNAWIALMDENHNITYTASSGFDGDFDKLEQLLFQKEFPLCMRKVIQDELLEITENPEVNCMNCPVAESYPGRSGMCYHLSFQKEKYGILSVSAPAEYVHLKEEHDLFLELADDLGFALNKIEMEKRRKDTEEKYRESEAKFRLIAENTSDCITVMDLNLKTIYVSPSITKLRGYTVDEAMEHSIDEIFVPDSLLQIQQLYKDSMERLEEGKEGDSFVTLELQENHKNGSAIWVEVALSFIYGDDNKPTGILSVTRDISQRKKIEAQVAEKQREMSTLIANLPGMVYRCKFDREWTMMFISDGCKTITGYDPNELIGNKKLTFNEIIHPNKQAEIWNKWQQVISQRGVFEEEYEIRTKNDETRWVWERGQGVFDENGDCLFLEGFITDITDRKNAINKLRQNERLLQIAGQVSRLGGWSVDIETNKVKWSDEVAIIHAMPLGYSPDVKEGINFYAPEYRDRITEVFTKCAREGIPYDEELQIINSKGKRVWVRTTGIAEKDKLGKIISVSGGFQDITERKNAELALTNSENRFRSIVEGSPVPIFIHSDLKFAYLNPQAIKLFGAQYENDLIGMKVMERFHPDFHPTIITRIKTLLEERRSVETPIEQKYIRLDGSEVWVEVVGEPINYQGKNGALIFARDISERKIVEEKLKTSDRIFKHSLDMLCIAGFDGYFKVLNPSWSRVLGYSTEELLAKPWNDFVHSDDIEATNNIKSKIVDGKEVYQFENRFICKDGAIKWLAWNSFPYLDEDIMFGVARDITEKKKIEKELETSKNKLLSLFNVIPTGIGLVQDRIIREVNPRLCEMTGYDLEELIGNNARMLYLTDEDYEYVGRVKYDMIAKTGTGTVETRWKRKDGTTLNILLASTPLDINDASKGVTFTATDITELKILSETLRKSEHTLQKIFETIPVGLWFADKEGTLIRGNEAGIKIWGAEPKVSPKDYGVFQARRLPSGEEITSESWALYQTVHEGKTILNELLEIDALDGVKRIILNSTAPIIDEQGNMMGAIIVNQDITELKKAEMEIQFQAQKFRSLILNSKDIISMYAADGAILYKSPGLKNILGYEPDEVTGLNVMELVHPDDRQNAAEALKKLLELPTSESVQLNIRAVHKDGSVRWLEATLTNMLEEPGVKALIGNYRNITERIQTEMIGKIQYNIAHAMVTAKNLNDLFALVRNELSQLLDTTNFIIAEYDKHKDMLTAPFERDEHTKTPPAWSSKNSISGLVIRNKTSLLLRKKDILQLAANGEIVLRGSRAESWLGVPLMINQRPIGLMILQSYTNPEAFNKSSQKILEIIANQLSIYIEQKNSELLAQKLSKAIIQNPASIVITDPGGIIEFVNPKFTELTGYSMQEVLGQNPSILKSGEHDEIFYKNLWDTITSGKDWSGEIKNKKKDGSRYWESAIISPLVNDEGLITHFVAVKEDITERKKMVEDLIIAKEQAEASDRLKTAFMNNISHEIRTPLSGITGFGQLITQPDLTEEEMESYMEILEQSTERLISTINDYMDASLIASNNLKPVISSFDLNQFLSEVFGNFEWQCKEKSLELKLITPDRHENLRLTTDRELLQKVFHHVLGNALKFTSAGTISFGYTIKASTIEFWIKDTGIGIKPEVIEKIFSAFSQEETGSTRKYQGSGLGLTISNGIITNLGGKMWLSSQKSAGTVINFTLPLESAIEATPEILPTEIKASAIEDPLLLIAEDEESNFLYLKALLKKSPVRILRAYNGQEAVDYCRNNPDISLVLMDIKMPILNGIEATKQIKRFRKNLPVIAVTAHALTGDEHRIREAGCDDYISKPLKKEVLWSKLIKAGIELEL